MTNFERIKEMSVEELAEKLAKDIAYHFCKTQDGQTCSNTRCKEGIKHYLESKVEE